MGAREFRGPRALLPHSFHLEKYRKQAIKKIFSANKALAPQIWNALINQ
jgi:hypothetical protein